MTKKKSLAPEWNRKLAHGPVRVSKMRKMEAAASRWAVWRPKGRRSSVGGFPLCTSKQKRLAMKSRNLPKSYVIETKPVSELVAARSRKTRGEKMKVSSIMLLKTNVGKVSETGLSIILMKTKIVAVDFPLC